ISFLLTDALRIIWRENWLSKEEKKYYALKVFELTLRLNEITDGDHTWRGPYSVIEIVADDEIELAEEFKRMLIKNRGNRNVSNSAITSILISKVQHGWPIDDICVWQNKSAELCK